MLGAAGSREHAEVYLKFMATVDFADDALERGIKSGARHGPQTACLASPRVLARADPEFTGEVRRTASSGRRGSGIRCHPVHHHCGCDAHVFTDPSAPWPPFRNRQGRAVIDNLTGIIQTL